MLPATYGGKSVELIPINPDAPLNVLTVVNDQRYLNSLSESFLAKGGIDVNVLRN